MKKLALLLLISLVPLAAQERRVMYEFDPLTTQGAKSEAISVHVGRSAVTYHTIEVNETNTSTCEYTVEGTVSGNTWFDISGTQSCTSDAMIHIVNRVVTQLRISLDTLTGASATTTFHYLGVAQ